MALNTAPSIVTSGLVFSCDMSNRKSYAGPPITNKTLHINTAGISTATGYVATEGTEVVTIPQIGPVNLKYVNIQNNYTSHSPNSTNCCPSLFQYGGYAVTGSTLYTYGIVYKVDSGYTHPNFMYRYEYNGGTYVTEAGVHDTNKRVYLGDGWWWAWNTFTTQASTTSINSSGLWYYQYSPYSDKISVAKIFVAEGNWTALHPKYWPECNTTRSTTQTILDQTNNNTITASSLTYNSDGSFSFNGSNRISFTMSGSASQIAYTRIVWIKPTASSSDMKSVMLNNIGNNSDMAVGIADGYVAFHQYTNSNGTGTNSDLTISGVTPVPLNQNCMISITVDRSITTNNVKVYLNGALDVTGSRNLGTSNSDSVILGGPASDSYAGLRMFYGTVYSASHYNRALSAAEIQQNFNALRGRYGL